MKCTRKRQLADYQVGLLSAPEAERMAAHLRTCEACRAELAALRRTAELLRPAPAAEPPRDLWPAIQAQLKPRQRAATPRTSRLWRPALATALVLLLVVGAIWLVPGANHAPLPFAPPGEADTYAQVQLAAAWDAPLADHAALGLAMLATLDESSAPEVAN